ncbi:MAG: hypothetical protein GXY10_02605 [Clostridiales bacterium]|jgi:hypothetical protein|nr:hypothetical protein [Clostridiales bacterium]
MAYQTAPGNPRNVSVSVRPSYGPPNRPRPIQQNPNARPQQKAIPVKRKRRKEREYFFIMRRGVCFLMMVFSLIWIAIILLNYLNILPNYTSFLVEKDLTPLDERLETDTGELDDDGNAIMLPYVDQSKYISMMDPIYGGISAILKQPMVDANGVSLSPFYDEMYEKIMGAPEEEVEAEAADEEPEEAPELTEEELLAQAREQDPMMMVAKIAFPYFPVALVVSALGAVLIFILSLFSMFGRRIFKGFFIFALIMVLAGVMTFIGGFVASGVFSGAPKYLDDGVTLVSVIDFTKALEFLTGAFTAPPATAIDPEIDVAPIPLVSGYGTLAVLVAPIVIMLLALFARRKVPYSIFDK